MKHSGAMLFCIAGVAAALLAGCDRQQEPMQRPSIVPPSATWAGGGSGAGAYFDCSVGDPQTQCTVWDEAGDVVTHGAFLLEGSNRPAYLRELHYVRATEDKIYLADDLVLRKVH